MAITTSTILAAPVQQSFNRKLLSVDDPNLIHAMCADKYSMPKNGGTTLRFRRYDKLEKALVPLGNTGVTPPSQSLNAINIDAQMNFYGTWVEINQQVVLQSQDAVLNQTTSLLGYSLRETEDSLVRDMLAATAAHINCVHGVNGDNPSNINAQDVNDATRALRGSNAKSISRMIGAADLFGTAPVRDAYYVLSHTDIEADLNNVAGFIHKSAYASQKNVPEAEWGNVANARFMTSTEGSTDSNASFLGVDVYNNFFVGMEAYGIINQDGYSSRFIYHDARLNGPLELNQTAGYVMSQACRILNDSCIINLRSTLR